MFALTDFTVANGATQVLPSSHLWPADRKAEPEEVIQAEMKAGSALFYLGSTLHGGAAISGVAVCFLDSTLAGCVPKKTCSSRCLSMRCERCQSDVRSC